MSPTPGTVQRYAPTQLHPYAPEILAYDRQVRRPAALTEAVCRQSVEQLNQLLADTVMLRDLYKKHHRQVAGPAFDQLRLVYDRHFGEQSAFVDTVAERIQLLGGTSLAMPCDIAETTLIPRPPRTREDVPAQIERLLQAHEILLREARRMAHEASLRGDERTSDLISEVIRTSEMQVWFLSEQVLDAPLVHAE